MPNGFAEELMSDWSRWVLDHGLPRLPAEVAPGQSIPIAYWAGPAVGAVLHVQASAADQALGEPAQFNDEVQCFRRVDDTWQDVNAIGGSNWPPGPSLAPIDVPAGTAWVSGEFTTGGDGYSVTVMDGRVGADVAWIEVSDATGTLTRPIDAPLGIVVVAVTDVRPVTIRFLDQHRNEIGCSTLR